MASTDSRPVPIKNTAFRAVFPILDADGDLVTGATGLDSEVSQDQGTFADCTNEATEIATSSGMYYLDLTSTEMNADCVAVIVKTTSSGAKTTVLVFYPEEAGDINVDVTAWNGTAIPGVDTAGYPKVTIKDGTGTGEIDTTSGGVLVAAIAANAITATAINADAITAAKIADGAIDAATFAAGAIDAAAIAADAIGASQLATGAVAEIADAIWDEATSGHVTAGSYGLAASDILADTADMQPKLGTPAGASVSADIAAMQVSADSLSDDVGLVRDRLNALATPPQTIGSTGNDTTHIHVPGWTYGDDEILDQMLVIYDDSSSEYHARWIADWVNATKLATVATLPFTPEGATDLVWVLSIRRDSGLTAAETRTAVGLASANLDTQLTNIDNFVDDLETRVGTPSNFGSGATVAANLIDLETLVDDLEARIGTPANLGGGATIAQNLSDIEAQTDDIGAAGAGLTAIPTVAAVTTVTNLTNAPTAGDLTATMKASVNAEVLDVLNTDTFAEPGQGNPPATATLVQKIGYLYKAWRNRSTVTSSEYALYADNGTTKDQEAAVSDDGTTFERAEIQTGA